MADFLTSLSDFAKNYASDAALKKKAYGKTNPTTKEMQDTAAKMAEKYYPEKSVAAQPITVSPKPVAPAMTPKDLLQMRDERARAAAARAKETVDKVIGKK